VGVDFAEGEGLWEEGRWVSWVVRGSGAWVRAESWTRFGVKI
jgi:hypothetical protein